MNPADITTSTSRSLDIGATIRHFEVLEVFPLGGFGVTYRAWDSKLNRQVAIKEFFPEGMAERQYESGAMTVVPLAQAEAEFRYRLQQYLDEARVLASFNHPNIIKVYDFFEASGSAYIVMEYADGLSLKELLARCGVLSQRQCLDLFVPILQGLEVVHSVGFLHRDIKPGNIYVRDSGEPVLIDFGAAREHSGSAQTITAMVSLGYAPPEQYSRDSKWLGPWSDLYSIGASIYHCVNGNAPEEATERQTHVNEDGFDPLKSALELGNSVYSREFLLLIDHLLQLRVKSRPQSVAEVLSQLRQLSTLKSASLEAIDSLSLAALVSGDDSAPLGSDSNSTAENITTEQPTRVSESEQATVLAGAELAASSNSQPRLKAWPRHHYIIAALLLCLITLLALLSVSLWQPTSPQIPSQPVAATSTNPSNKPSSVIAGSPTVETSQPSCSGVDLAAEKLPPWQAQKVYNAGDRVSFNDLVWRAQWWNQNQRPTEAEVWLMESNVQQSWGQNTVYNGGDEINHFGQRYRAKWWSKGDAPGAAEVWLLLGESNCSD